MYSFKNEKVPIGCNSELTIEEQIYRNVLRCYKAYGHLEKMEEERVVKLIYGVGRL